MESEILDNSTSIYSRILEVRHLIRKFPFKIPVLIKTTIGHSRELLEISSNIDMFMPADTKFIQQSMYQVIILISTLTINYAIAVQWTWEKSIENFPEMIHYSR